MFYGMYRLKCAVCFPGAGAGAEGVLNRLSVCALLLHVIQVLQAAAAREEEAAAAQAAAEVRLTAQNAQLKTTLDQQAQALLQQRTASKRQLAVSWLLVKCCWVVTPGASAVAPVGGWGGVGGCASSSGCQHHCRCWPASADMLLPLLQAQQGLFAYTMSLLLALTRCLQATKHSDLLVLLTILSILFPVMAMVASCLLPLCVLLLAPFAGGAVAANTGKAERGCSDRTLSGSASDQRP